MKRAPDLYRARNTPRCIHGILYDCRSERHHLYGGSDTRDRQCWPQLQAGRQLPVALQAEHTQRWLAPQVQPLQRRWRLWSPGDTDQPSPPTHDLMD